MEIKQFASQLEDIRSRLRLGKLCSGDSQLYRISRAFLRFILLLFVGLNGSFANATGNKDSLDATVNETVVMLPVVSNGIALTLQTTLFKPAGGGPFPVVIMNHGKNLGKTSQHQRRRYLAMSREFIKRGYAVVIPMRKGFAQSDGDYVDLGCNMVDNGQWQADDIEAVINSLPLLPFIDRQRIVVAGESYGGLAALAIGTRQIDGVKGIINFSGGLRLEDGSCDWKESLITATASYGAQTKIPSIWFYGENDSLFDQALADRMHESYEIAGGASKFIAFGKFKHDAHEMISSHNGLNYWLEPTERFLSNLSLPSTPNLKLPDPQLPAATDYAELDDIDAVPYLRQAGRTGYQDYLKKSTPRAFAISPSGAWGWAEDGDDPPSRALATCQKYSNSPCTLYSIDSTIVWNAASETASPKVTHFDDSGKTAAVYHQNPNSRINALATLAGN